MSFPSCFFWEILYNVKVERKTGKEMQKTQRTKVISGIRRMISEGKYTAGNRLPTEHELAEELNVSRGTVRSGLRELVAEGILEQRPGVGSFVSNGVTSDRSGKVPAAEKTKVLFLVSMRKGEFNFQLLEGMESVLFRHGLELAVYNIADSQEKVRQVLERIEPDSCAGILFSPVILPNYYDINSRILDGLDQTGIKYVVVDSPVAENGVIRGNFVGSDGYTAEREIVRYLVESGHRRIGSIRVFSSVYTADQRFSGICDELRRKGLPLIPELHTVIENVPLHEQGRQRIHELLALPDPPTAIICSHDFLALNVMDELGKLGRTVPDDLSIIGFDDEIFAATFHLTTVRQPFREIGVRAAEILLEEKNHGRHQEFLPCRLIERKTVAKINGNQRKGEL